jgi:hypothetical protein
MTPEFRCVFSKAGVGVEPPTAWTFFFSVERLQGPDGSEKDLKYKPLDGARHIPAPVENPVVFCTMHLLFMVVLHRHASRSKL